MELRDALEFARTRDHGVLVTIKRDGLPQLSNITYSLGDDGVFRISVTASRAKTANARRDPRVSLHVTRDDFYAYAVIEGRAEVTPVATDPGDDTVEELIEYYRTAAGEHPDWDEYRRVMVADGRLVLRVHPERAYGMLPSPAG
jgi:PPOX class probable F420-dependent enzyme